MLTDKERKQILETLIGIVRNISDKDYQRMVWIRGEGPWADDFDETVNDFSLESDGVLEHYKDYGITDTQYQVLKDFQRRFEVFYHANYWPEWFIDTPEWTEITELAKSVLKAFKYKVDERKQQIVESWKRSMGR